MRAPLAGHTTERAPQTPGCTSAYVLMGDRDRTHITVATVPVRALGGPSNARTGLSPCTSGCRLRGEGLSEGKTKVVGPPRRKNEGGAGQNFLKVTQNNLRKAKRRSNEGPAKENPGLRNSATTICTNQDCQGKLSLLFELVTRRKTGNLWAKTSNGAFMTITWAFEAAQLRISKGYHSKHF